MLYLVILEYKCVIFYKINIFDNIYLKIKVEKIESGFKIKIFINTLLIMFYVLIWAENWKLLPIVC